MDKLPELSTAERIAVRDKHVLELQSLGYSRPKIAKQLGISQSSVKGALKRVAAKQTTVIESQVSDFDKTRLEKACRQYDEVIEKIMVRVGDPDERLADLVKVAAELRACQTLELKQAPRKSETTSWMALIEAADVLSPANGGIETSNKATNMLHYTFRDAKGKEICMLNDVPELVVPVNTADASEEYKAERTANNAKKHKKTYEMRKKTTAIVIAGGADALKQQKLQAMREKNIAERMQRRAEREANGGCAVKREEVT